MTKKYIAQDYHYTLFYSPEDGEWVGLCDEFESLSHLGETPGEAAQGIVDLVDDVLKDMAESGEAHPTPNTD